MAVGDSRVASLSQAPPTQPSPPAQEVLGGLERILGSGDFDGSPRSRDFLRFIVEEALAGRPEGLTQAAIAVRVFGRRADFDATVDPIVRIQAGRLRRSLERYYLLEGADDPVHIELPRGGYVPVFRWAGPAHPTEAGTGRRDPGEDRGGWPSIDLLVRAGREGEAEEAAARFRDYLAVELDRYRDVRVVGRHDPSRALPSAGNAPTFVLTVRLLEESGHPRVSVDLEHCPSARQVWAEEYQGGREPAEEFHRETARIVAAWVASEHGIVAQTLCGEALPAETEGTTYGALLHSYRFFLGREPAQFGPALEALRQRRGPGPGVCARLGPALPAPRCEPRVRGRDGGHLARAGPGLRPARRPPRPVEPEGALDPGVRPPRTGRDGLGSGRGRGRARAEPGELRLRGGDRLAPLASRRLGAGHGPRPEGPRAQSPPHGLRRLRDLRGPPPTRRVRGRVPGRPPVARPRILLAQPHAGLLPRAPRETGGRPRPDRRHPPDEARLHEPRAAR